MEQVWIVTTKNNEQFMCPTEHDAEETFEVRGGVKIETAMRRYAEYRWRKNAAEKWGEWKYLE